MISCCDEGHRLQAVRVQKLCCGAVGNLNSGAPYRYGGHRTRGKQEAGRFARQAGTLEHRTGQGGNLPSDQAGPRCFKLARLLL